MDSLQQRTASFLGPRRCPFASCQLEQHHRPLQLIATRSCEAVKFNASRRFPSLSGTSPQVTTALGSTTSQPPRTPLQREGTCVQVPAPVFLDLGPSSQRFWELLSRQLVPPAARRDVAVLLACLESVYRAEYQQLAGEALAAIAAANAIHVRPDGSIEDPPDTATTTATNSGIAKPGSSDLGRLVLEGAYGSGYSGYLTADAILTSLDDISSSNGSSSGSGRGWGPKAEQRDGGLRDGNVANVGNVGNVGAGSDSVRESNSTGRSNSSTSTNSVQDEGGDDLDDDRSGDSDGDGGGDGDGVGAADLDGEAMRRLLWLARRAGYQPLTLRDVRLADSLNADYLSQLFIKGSTNRLDGALVQPYVDPSLPAEARPVLLLQRGYGTERQAGRLLLQKLDYLQTLAVRKAGAAAAGVAAGAVALLFGTLEASGGKGDTEEEEAGGDQQQQQGPSWGGKGRDPEVGVGVDEAVGSVAGAGGAAAQGGDVGMGGREVHLVVTSSAAAVAGARGAPSESSCASPSEAAAEVAAATSSSPAAIAAASESQGVGGMAAGGPVQTAAAAAAADGAATVAATARRLRGNLVGVAPAAEPTSPGAVALMQGTTALADAVHPVQPRDGSTALYDTGIEEEVVLEAMEAASGGGDVRGLAAEAMRERYNARSDDVQVLTAAAAAAADNSVNGSLDCVRGDVAFVPGGASGSSGVSGAGGGDGSAQRPVWGARAACGSASERHGSEQQPGGREGKPPGSGGGGGPQAAAVTAEATGRGDQVVAAEEETEGSGSPWTAAVTHLYSALSDWGLVPRADVIPLPAFNRHFPVAERPGRRPLLVCKVSLADALGGGEGGGEGGESGGGEWLGGGLGGLLDGLLREVQLQEPTYREMLLVYRPAHSRMVAPPPPTHQSPPLPHRLSLPLLPGGLPFSTFLPRPLGGGGGGGGEDHQNTPQHCNITSTSYTSGAASTNAASHPYRAPPTPPLNVSNVLNVSSRRGESGGSSEGEDGGGVGGGRIDRSRGGRGERRDRLRVGKGWAGGAVGEEMVEEEEEEGERGVVGEGRGEGGSGRGLRSGWLRRLVRLDGGWRWWKWGRSGQEPAVRRPPIQIRIYRDIPLPTWKVVLPEKLLQFRPLDLLRVDLFALAGLAGIAAQARYENFVLDVITFGSAAVLLVRIVLGYQRMSDRFRSVVNELLVEKALAGQEGAVEALASGAAQQQLRQAALAYVLLLHHCGRAEGGGGEWGGGPEAGAGGESPMATEAVGAPGGVCCVPGVATTSRVQELAEGALAQYSGLQVRFNACQALHELQRLGLIVRVDPSYGDSSSHGCPVDEYDGPYTVASYNSYDNTSVRTPLTPTTPLQQQAVFPAASEKGGPYTASPFVKPSSSSSSNSTSSSCSSCSVGNCPTNSNTNRHVKAPTDQQGIYERSSNNNRSKTKTDSRILAVSPTAPTTPPTGTCCDCECDSKYESGCTAGLRQPYGSCCDKVSHSSDAAAGGGCACADVWWAAVPLRDAVPMVEDHWGGLLWRRVGAILKRQDMYGGH